MADRCPTCGSLVTVVQADEGTASYQSAVTVSELDALQACVSSLRMIGDFLPGPFGGNARAALRNLARAQRARRDP